MYGNKQTCFIALECKCPGFWFGSGDDFIVEAKEK
jgi:hypothetical protein